MLNWNLHRRNKTVKLKQTQVGEKLNTWRHNAYEMLTIALLQARIFVVTRNKNYIIYVKMKNFYISL